MSDGEKVDVSSKKNHWHKYRFVSMLSVVIVTSLVLTAISLEIYNTSGAAQVDLSRPGYQSVRKAATTNESTDQFPASGTLDDDSFSQFYSMYDRRAARSVDAPSFSDQALSDDSLQFFVDNTAQTESTTELDVPAN